MIESEIPESSQRRNGLVFLVNTSLAYLVAPVFYVGVLHAAILKSFETNDTVANLPESVYLWVTPLPVLVAWLWPSPGLLRPMLTSCLVAIGLAGGAVAVLFVAAHRGWISSGWLVPALVTHAAVIGVGNGVRNMCLWELIGRGMSPDRRGRMLGWTFGIGPLFAVLGSGVTDLALRGNFLGLVTMTPLPKPWVYVFLFGSTCPAMLLSAGLVMLAHVPSADEHDSRTRLAEIGRGLALYFLNPLILAAAISFLLTYGGTMIMNNMSLYARDALDAAPEDYAGLQLALRFGFKCLAGFALGWLVTRLSAKASLLATTSICLAGVAWAMFVPGKWYLLSFGLLGAGELFYVYYMNYIVGCSAAAQIRQNTAYTNLITVSIGFLPLVFGAVSDRYGLPSSFIVAMGILAFALLVVQLRLPRQPTNEI